MQKNDDQLEKTERSQKLDTIFTCPMHPKVEQDHSGSCPNCGMTLIPEKPGKDSHEADIIVIGTHSRKWLEKIIMGSVAENVLENANLPLFIIPTKKEAEKK